MPIPPPPPPPGGQPNAPMPFPPSNMPMPIPMPIPPGGHGHIPYPGPPGQGYPVPAPVPMMSQRRPKSKRRDDSSDDESSVGSRSRSSNRSGGTRSSTSSRSRGRGAKDKRRPSRYFDDNGDQDSAMGSSEDESYVDDRKASRSKSRSRKDRGKSSRRSIGSSSRSTSTAGSRSSGRSGSTRRSSTKMAVSRRHRSSRRHGRDDTSSESSDESSDQSRSSRGTSSRGSSRKSMSSQGTSVSNRSRSSVGSAYTYKDRSSRKKSRARYSDSDSDGPASIATTRPGRSGGKRYKQNSGLIGAANPVAFEARRGESHASALAQVFANSARFPWAIERHQRTHSCLSRCVGCAMRDLMHARQSRDASRTFGPFKSWAHEQDASDPLQLLRKALRSLEKARAGGMTTAYQFQSGVACIHGHGAVESQDPSRFMPLKVSTRGLKSLDGALRKFAKGPVPKDWHFVQCQDRECRSRSHKDRTSKTSRREPYYSPRVFRGPERLVIVLDRYPAKERRASKDQSVIKCPPLLSIDPLVPKSKRSKAADTDYELNAVICDLGRSPGSGPYVTYMRTSDGWVKYDDRGSPPKRVSAGYAHENRDAYMLFYDKAVSEQPKSQTWHFKNTGNGFKWDPMPPPPNPFNALFGLP